MLRTHDDKDMFALISTGLWCDGTLYIYDRETLYHSRLETNFYTT